MVLGLLEVVVVAVQARHRSEVVAGCSGAEDLRAVTTPTLMTEEAVRLVVAQAGVVGGPGDWNTDLLERMVAVQEGLVDVWTKQSTRDTDTKLKLDV